MSLLAKTIKTFSAAIMAVTISYSANVSAAPMPGAVVQGGELVGLTNINVVGYGLDDVSFNNQFQNIFYDQNFVLAAGAAGIGLLGEGGIWDDTYFDLNPEKTKGCSGAASAGVCDWIVAVGPFQPGLILAGVLQNFGGNNDASDTAFPTVASSISAATSTYLDWTPSKVSEVPVPAAFFLFAPALLGFLGLRRKNKA